MFLLLCLRYNATDDRSQSISDPLNSWLASQMWNNYVIWTDYASWAAALSILYLMQTVRLCKPPAWFWCTKCKSVQSHHLSNWCTKCSFALLSFLILVHFVHQMCGFVYLWLYIYRLIQSSLRWKAPLWDLKF